MLICSAFPTRDAYSLVEFFFVPNPNNVLFFYSNKSSSIKFDFLIFFFFFIFVFFCSNAADSTQQTFTMSDVSVLTIKIKLTLMNKSPEARRKSLDGLFSFSLSNGTDYVARGRPYVIYHFITFWRNSVFFHLSQIQQMSPIHIGDCDWVMDFVLNAIMNILLANAYRQLVSDTDGRLRL